MGKQNVILRTERYPAIKRNEIVIHGTTWTNLENTVLSKITQTNMGFHLYELFRIV